MKTINQYFLFLFIVVFLCENFGINIVLITLKKNSIHRSHANYVPHSKIKKIQVDIKKINVDFLRIDKNEIKWNGKLFDIISEESKNGVITFFVLPDNFENNMLKILENFCYSFSDQQTPKKNVHIFPAFLKELITIYNTRFEFTPTWKKLVVLQDTTVFFLAELFLPVNNPPPES